MSLAPEVESLVADAPVSAHLATSVDDRPHVAPVWYGYRDGVVYFVTGGRKLANLRRNPRAALSIEDASGGDVAWNVTLLGRARVVDDPERIEWARGWIYERYDGDAAADGEESVETDGGNDDGDDYDYALVEFEAGSAAWNVYE